MSYEVLLDKAVLDVGRDYMNKNIVGFPVLPTANPGSVPSLPPGAVSLLQANLLSAEAYWHEYKSYLDQWGFSSGNFRSVAEEPKFCGWFKTAATYMTLAAELLQHFQRVLRKAYLPYAQSMTQEEHEYLNRVHRLLNLMAEVVDKLLMPVPDSTAKGGILGGTALYFQEAMRAFLLRYAKHLAERAVGICLPDLSSRCDYMRTPPAVVIHRPQAAEWLDRLARVQEHIAVATKSEAKWQRSLALHLRAKDLWQEGCGTE